MGTAAMLRSFVSLGTVQSLSDSGLQGSAHATCVLDFTIATQGSSYFLMTTEEESVCVVAGDCGGSRTRWHKSDGTGVSLSR